MYYNFKKNIIKNENNSYTLSINLPKKYNVLNYKIYNHKYLLQSGYFENSKIKKKINLNINKLDTIFIQMNYNSNEYFELVNLKNIYNKILENIKINFVKNNKNSDDEYIINDDTEDEDDDDDDDNDDDNNDNDDNDDNNNNDDNDNEDDDNSDLESLMIINKD